MKKINLSGKFFYRLDNLDKGVSEQWQNQKFQEKTLNLPGSLGENGIGEKFDTNSYKNFTTDILRRLEEKYQYIGLAWYQKEILIEDNLENKTLKLYLERVMTKSTVYIDGNLVGECSSLSTAHIYDITNFIKKDKKSLVTISIDNRDVNIIGDKSSAYTLETQGIWNGVVGDIEILVFDDIYIHDINIFPDLKNKIALCKFTLFNNSSLNEINIGFQFENMHKNLDFKVKNVENELSFQFDLDSDLILWSEFTPKMYEIELNINNSSYRKSFGVREIKVIGKTILLNGEKIFLRGEIDCCIFPLTAYPSMDRQYWEFIMTQIKDYGLNHLRFHSWCPPDIAFQVADEFGIYLQVEGPIWLDTWFDFLVGGNPNHYKYFPEEASRILKAYSNHPSFCFFSNGNELNGDFELLSKIIKDLKKDHSRQIFTLTSNWDRKRDEQDDFFIAQTIDGEGARGQYFLDELVESGALKFDKALENCKIPFVIHEVGQYSVYPDMSEIEEYTGVMYPVNFLAIKENLLKKNLLHYSNEFLKGSGVLSYKLYKAEIEALIKTKDMAGIQLLGLRDFTGQSTATIGMLNAFWKNKNIIKPEEYRYFSNSIVCLMDMEKRIYSNQEKFQGEIQIANYSDTNMNDKNVSVAFKNGKGETFYGKVFTNSFIKKGEISIIGKIELNFSGIKKSEQFKVEINVGSFCNIYDIWVYPEENINLSDDIIYVTKFEDVKENVAKGKNILFVPEFNDIVVAYGGNFFPPFWSPVHFKTSDCCGIICDNKNNVFENFPTEKYIDFQWKAILENSFAIDISKLEQKFTPIVQMIPNFFNNNKSSILFELEIKETKSKIFVCSVDIFQNANNKIELNAFKNAVLRYVNSSYFRPTQAIEISELDKIFTMQISDNTHKDLAYKKNATSSKIRSYNFNANKAINGNPKSSFCSADFDNYHWWMVDLEKVRKISKIIIEFSEKANYKFTLEKSDDNIVFEKIYDLSNIENMDAKKVHEIDTNIGARYLKLTYNTLPSSVYASHCRFEVY